MFKTILVILLLLFLNSRVYSDLAEDHWSSDPDSATELGLANALKLVNSEKYADALTLLKTLEKESPENADVHNLLGYAFRKTGDFEKSLPAYEKALYLKPTHRGALEYQGELFLALGKVNEATLNLEKLKVICPKSCPELEDLKMEIQAWQRAK